MLGQWLLLSGSHNVSEDVEQNADAQSNVHVEDGHRQEGDQEQPL